MLLLPDTLIVPDFNRRIWNLNIKPSDLRSRGSSVGCGYSSGEQPWRINAQSLLFVYYWLGLNDRWWIHWIHWIHTTQSFSLANISSSSILPPYATSSLDSRPLLDGERWSPRFDNCHVANTIIDQSSRWYSSYSPHHSMPAYHQNDKFLYGVPTRHHLS
jgi:hypothetical protein